MLVLVLMLMGRVEVYNKKKLPRFCDSFFCCYDSLFDGN